jgi:hypothetical protein
MNSSGNFLVQNIYNIICSHHINQTNQTNIMSKMSLQYHGHDY